MIVHYGVLRRAERGLTIGLILAHNFVQTARRPRARVVFERGDAVEQVAAFAVHIGRAEQAVLKIRVAQQVGQQTDDTGGQAVRARCIGLIDAVRQKADAQVFALLADSGLDACAVELIERRAERPHIVQHGRTAAQHLRQTRAQRGILAAERQHQHGAQHSPLKLRRGDAGEIHPGTQLFSGHLLHNFPRFRKDCPIGNIIPYKRE